MAVYSRSTKSRDSYKDFKCVKVSDTEMRCSVIQRQDDGIGFYVIIALILISCTIGYQLRKRVFVQKNEFEGLCECMWAMIAPLVTAGLFVLLCFVAWILGYKVFL